MDPIGSFSGLASGFQWRDMVDQMMQLEITRRFTPVQKQVSAAEKRRDAWNSFNGLLSKFSASVLSLKDGSAFGALKSTLSNGPSGKTLFNATTSSSATPGTYQVKVVELARADKLSGGAFASSTEALGIAGDFYVNGKRIEIAATDTLTTVRNAINTANSGGSPSGVSATILSTSATEHRLVLTSDATGTRGLELVDGDSGVLQALGVTTGGFTQNSKPGDATSTQTQRFTSSSTPLAAMLGVTAPPAVTTIDVDGTKITVDLENDTLLSLMNRIAAAGGTASLENETVGSTVMQRLTVAGAVTADAAAADPAISQRVVELLGFQTGDRASSITSGRDSLIEIDGFKVARRTNVISDAISGVTLNLQAEDASPVDLVVSRDLGAIVSAAEAMAKAYNELVQFADAQRKPGAPLAANGSLRTTMSSLSRTLLNGVSSLPASNPYTHASIAGIERTKEGMLTVDTAKLTSVLETNFADVQALLSTSGAATDGEVSYLLASAATVPGAYAIDITAVATQALHTGSVWADPNSYAASDGISDTLTLTDSFSGKSIDYELAQGTSLSVAVAELNARFADEKIELTATDEGGALRITAAQYGTAATFTVAGSAAAVLGMTETTFAGTDVAGTIGGLAATGAGQSLTGGAGGATEGLVIKYTGTIARAAGEVRYTLGVGGLLDQVVEPTIRANDGIIASQVGSIDRSIVSLNQRLDDIESRLEVRRQALIGQFTRMEGAMSLLQSQGNWLNSQIQSMNSARE